MEKPVNVSPVSLATLPKRFVNYLIDSVILCNAIVMLIGLLGTWLDTNYGYDDLVLGMPAIGNVKFSAFQAVVTFIYYGLFESLNGRTLGKYITGTVVIARDGSKPGEGTIFLRTLCRQIPFEFISFLFGLPLGWHDTLSKTLVVDAYDLERAKRQQEQAKNNNE